MGGVRAREGLDILFYTSRHIKPISINFRERHGMFIYGYNAYYEVNSSEIHSSNRTIRSKKF
jgi:hypothetical protein